MPLKSVQGINKLEILLSAPRASGVGVVGQNEIQVK